MNMILNSYIAQLCSVIIAGLAWFIWLIILVAMAGVVTASAVVVLAVHKKKLKTREMSKLVDEPAENVETEKPFEIEESIETQENVEEIEDAKAVESVKEIEKPKFEEKEVVAEIETEDKSGKIVKFANGFGILVRYNKSFLARLIQSSDEVKNSYSQLKNELLSYKKVKSRISWSYDSLNAGRNKLAKLNVRGKTLKIYLALDPDDYAGTKYKVERSESKRYHDVPCMYRITSPRRLKYAMDLIADVAKKYGLTRVEDHNEDFYMPYEETKALIDRALIKELISEEAYQEYMRRKNQAEIDKISHEFVSVADVKAMLASEIVEEIETEDQNGKIVKFANGFGIVVRYNKSFKARLIQSSDEVKNSYSQLKNELLSYKKVKSRISWSYDSLNAGRNKVAKFNVRGKTLKLYLALDPDDYVDTKYKVERSESKRYQDVPCLYRITSPRRLKYAMDLIADVAEKYGLKKGVNPNEDFYMPYEETKQLIDEGLIKELISEEAYEEYMRRKNQAEVDKITREFVSAAEVNAMISDDVAVSLVEDARKTVTPVKTSTGEVVHLIRSTPAHVGKKGIINIDVLSANFNADDTVTLDSLKAKGLISKNIGYVKVLARGTLNKPLNMELQDYSIDAIKMILLTGGKVKRV